MSFYITEFDNGSIQPRGDSVLMTNDPSCYMGKASLDVGNVKIWKTGTIRILLTRVSLTANLKYLLKTGVK